MKFLKSKLLRVLIILLLLAGIGCGIYLADFYHADTEAVAAFTADMQTRSDGNLVWSPENPVAGLIFYPGGKVDHTAYAPLMDALAARGILCIVVKMPFHLAVLDMDAAANLQTKFPQVEQWYIGGHSLGGSMAAAYLGSCDEDYSGLILLAAYSTADLHQTDLEVLSIYGSEDLVMDRKNYEQYRQNLPADFRELIIDGGCHAYFGMYGPQAGDGIPAISNEDQIHYTAEAIAELIGG